MGNMYSDSVFQWNVFKGCLFSCKYCIPSFQKQSKRQKNKCLDCYTYKPHFHPERLNINFNLKRYETRGDQFIWVGSSGDISFCKQEWLDQILDKIQQYPNRTFFMQTKDSYWFKDKVFPSNVILGITLETNHYYHYKIISKAPDPLIRATQFISYVKSNRKRVTIEPIIDFDIDLFLYWIQKINPEIVYIGYDTKKCGLPEPSIEKTLHLIEALRKFTVVKTKYLKEVKVKRVVNGNALFVKGN